MLQSKLQTQALQTFDSHTIASLLNNNSIELEQNCLHRIRNHRHTIEQVIELSQMQKAQLQQQAQTITKLTQQLEDLQTEPSYREAYEELKDEYELLYEKYEEAICQQKQMEKGHEKKVIELVKQIQSVKASQRRMKDQIIMLEVHWEQVTKDKDEMYARLEREISQKEQYFKQKINNLSKKNSELKRQSVQKLAQFQSRQREIRSNSKAKEKELEKIKKVLSKTQNQCSQYRILSSSKQNQIELQRQQMQENIQNLNLVISSLRKQVTQKIIDIEYLRQSLKKSQQKNKDLELNLQILHRHSKQSKGKQQIQIQKYDRQRQGRKRLQQQINRLKRENSKHVQDYNLLQIEMRRWKKVGQKREESNRLRKVLSNTNVH